MDSEDIAVAAERKADLRPGLSQWACESVAAGSLAIEQAATVRRQRRRKLLSVPTILIVESDTALRSTIVAALGSDYMVRGVDACQEALCVLRRSPVDLVILDMETERGDPLALLASLGAARRPPAVIALSSARQAAKAVKAMQLGARDYLPKPCDVESVKRSVEAALASAR